MSGDPFRFPASFRWMEQVAARGAMHAPGVSVERLRAIGVSAKRRARRLGLRLGPAAMALREAES